MKRLENQPRRYQVQHGLAKGSSILVHRSGDRVYVRWNTKRSHFPHHPSQITYYMDQRKPGEECARTYQRKKVTFRLMNYTGDTNRLRSFGIRVNDQFPWFESALDELIWYQFAENYEE